MRSDGMRPVGARPVGARPSRHPVIAPTLFRERGFVVGLVIVAGFYASLSAFVLVINLLLQQGLHRTPLRTGLTLIPWALGTAGAVLLADAVLLAGAVLAEKLGRSSLHLGLSITVVGLPALWWSVAHWGTDITVWKPAPSNAGSFAVPAHDRSVTFSQLGPQNLELPGGHGRDM
ncbi:hypothetical protein ACFC09_01245 [Streptomyces sp. NPDC056161]|uniref:hypothetical protein n=1 Tax=Streptomyces sp. NPDC056161 TaxID=3345732 RepID=UPI0035DFD205